QMGHFDGSEARFEAFIAALQAGAVDCLFQRIAGKHTENYRNAGVHLSELKSARSFRADIIVVRGYSAKNTANGDERVVLSRESEVFCGEGQFKCAGHMHDAHVAALGARTFEGIHGSCKQSLRDEAVEAADRNGKTQTAGGEVAADFSGLE